MDCRALSFADETFDLVLDKGTLDALYNNVSDVAERKDVADTVEEVHRVLRKDGVFAVVSLAGAERRTHVSSSAPWSSVTLKEVPRDGQKAVFLYLAAKALAPPEASPAQNGEL